MQHNRRNFFHHFLILSTYLCLILCIWYTYALWNIPICKSNASPLLLSRFLCFCKFFVVVLLKICWFRSSSVTIKIILVLWFFSCCQGSFVFVVLQHALYTYLLCCLFLWFHWVLVELLFRLHCLIVVNFSVSWLFVYRCLPLSHPQISNSNIFTPLATLLMAPLLLTLMWLLAIEVIFSPNVSLLPQKERCHSCACDLFKFRFSCI